MCCVLFVLLLIWSVQLSLQLINQFNRVTLNCLYRSRTKITWLFFIYVSIIRHKIWIGWLLFFPILTQPIYGTPWSNCQCRDLRCIVGTSIRSWQRLFSVRTSNSDSFWSRFEPENDGARVEVWWWLFVIFFVIFGNL